MKIAARVGSKMQVEPKVNQSAKVDARLWLMGERKRRVSRCVCIEVSPYIEGPMHHIAGKVVEIAVVTINPEVCGKGNIHSAFVEMSCPGLY